MGSMESCNSVMYDVFLIYPYKYIAFASILAERLVEAGFRVWFSEWKLIPGENLRESIAKGLEKSRTSILFLGPEEPSGYFKVEMERALNKQKDEKNFRVIPLLLDDSAIDNWKNDFPPQICINFKNGVDDNREFHKLICGIRGVSPERPIQIKTQKFKSEIDDLEIEMKLRFKIDKENGHVDVEVIKEPERMILKGIEEGEDND